MVRVVLIAFAFVWLGAIAAFAEIVPTAEVRHGSEAAAPAPPKVTYLLIDVSGSMEGKDAEAKVQSVLEPIKTGDGLVSRTYFRADTGQACWAPIKIAEPVPVSKSTPLTFEYKNDYTPLGEGLKAALLHAVRRGGEADIYLVSDEDPTPGCGIDVCAVADAYLPINGISVKSIAVDEKGRVHHDRLGCIAAAEGRPTAAAANFEKRREANISAPVKDWNPLERWSWLIGFVLIALSSLGFGIVDSNKSVDRESLAADARSFRRMIEQGDNSAKEKLDKIIDEYVPLERKSGFHALLQAIKPKFWFIWLAVIWLVVLTLMPTNTVWWEFRIEAAQKAAWKVLDTNFSTAFAGTWLALLYFWASQNQRLREADRNLRIATDEGERIAKLKMTAAQNNALKVYNRTRSTVAGQTFDIPFRGQGGSSSELIGEQAESLRRIELAAISLALGSELSAQDGVDALDAETERLSHFEPSIIRSFIPWSVVDFAKRLQAKSLFPARAKEEWDALAHADHKTFAVVVGQLARKLVEDQASS